MFSSNFHPSLDGLIYLKLQNNAGIDDFRDFAIDIVQYEVMISPIFNYNYRPSICNLSTSDLKKHIVCFGAMLYRNQCKFIAILILFVSCQHSYSKKSVFQFEGHAYSHQ